MGWKPMVAVMGKKYDNYIYELEAKVKAERRKHPIRWVWYDFRNWCLRLRKYFKSK